MNRVIAYNGGVLDWECEQRFVQREREQRFLEHEYEQWKPPGKQYSQKTEPYGVVSSANYLGQSSLFSALPEWKR